MKSSVVSSGSARATPTAGPAESARERWPLWVDALHRYQLQGLAGWLLDAGRPLSFISAQIMYMVTPFVGAGAERVGRLLESDEDSRAFLDLLGTDKDDQGPMRRMGQG